MNSILEVDNGTRTTCSKLQVFIKTPHGKYPDAISLLDPVYEPFKESLFYAKGFSRVFVDLPPVSGETKIEAQVKNQVSTYRDAFFAFMSYSDSFMFTNNKPRREFYMYYSGTESPKKDHDFNFCDNGYNCFEIDYSEFTQEEYDAVIEKLASFLSIVTSAEPFDEKNKGHALCTGGEFKVVGYKNQIKFKTMPQFDLSNEFFDKLFDAEFVELLRASKKNRA